jgi:uncharacterized protein with von Willebrand factor type A (vWA) domain
MNILADRSGSMEGEPMVWMRAVAACALLQAVDQKRRAILTLFDDKAVSVIVEPRTAKRDLADALKLLAESTRGGTNIEGALVYSGGMMSAKMRDTADTLLITDGIFNTPGSRAIGAVRTGGARVHLVGVGSAEIVKKHTKWTDTRTSVSAYSDAEGVAVLGALNAKPATK